jgi:hypothetical protein
LLQENGYFVLRFLAEDVGKELDVVLDAILRVLARRRQSANAAPLKFVRKSSARVRETCVKRSSLWLAR